MTRFETEATHRERREDGLQRFNFSLALLRKHDIVYGNFHVLFLIGYLAKCTRNIHINFKFHPQENRLRQWLRDFDKTQI